MIQSNVGADLVRIPQEAAENDKQCKKPNELNSGQDEADDSTVQGMTNVPEADQVQSPALIQQLKNQKRHNEERAATRRRTRRKEENGLLDKERPKIVLSRFVLHALTWWLNFSND
jgi:hypothetical protein